MARMTITQALTEKKLLKKRIEKAIAGGKYFGISIGNSATPVDKAYRTKEEEAAAITASTDRVIGLIDRYREIVSKLVVSNANTTITIGGKEMSVASAIECKNSIEFDMGFLSTLKNHLSTVSREIGTIDTRMNSDIQTKMVAMYGGDAIPEVTSANYAAIADPHRAKHNPVLHDPKGLVEYMRTHVDHVDDFKANIETELNISNATTYIDLE